MEIWFQEMDVQIYARLSLVMNVRPQEFFVIRSVEMDELLLARKIVMMVLKQI